MERNIRGKKAMDNDSCKSKTGGVCGQAALTAKKQEETVPRSRVATKEVAASGLWKGLLFRVRDRRTFTQLVRIARRLAGTPYAHR